MIFSVRSQRDEVPIGSKCKIQKVVSSLPETADMVGRSLAALSNYAHDGDHPKVKKEVKYVKELLAKELKRVKIDLKTDIVEHNRNSLISKVNLQDMKGKFQASEKAFRASEKALQARVTSLQEDEMSLEMSFHEIMDTLEQKTEAVPPAETEEVPPAETEEIPPGDKKSRKQRVLCK